MFDAYVDQLNDRDPQRRREAIIALGRSKNLAAIPHLSKVFREDPDNELRELARKAATYIRQNNPDVGASTEVLPGRSSSAVRLIGGAAAGSAAGAAAGASAAGACASRIRALSAAASAAGASAAWAIPPSNVAASKAKVT